ncbi:DUF4783 domain-containing protein [Pseudopedobacter sp.]|uniref:DUF4783 domain-containing protein n=1 Tax=Pseudopedobacter sp. TaxID=1936787 RepID=UPI00333FFDE7
MKTLKNIYLILALMLVSSMSFAKDKNSAQKTLAFSVDNYIQSLKSGYNENLADILSDQVKININRNGQLLTYGKEQALKHNKNASNVVQNCDITHNVITQSDNYAIVNVSMKYEHFTRENIISLTKTDRGWKITEVNSVFK